MFNKFPALRRVLIYTVLSYIGLILVNNSNYELDNMWLIYAPMFVTIYIFSRWLDSKLAANNTSDQKNNNDLPQHKADSRERSKSAFATRFTQSREWVTLQ